MTDKIPNESSALGAARNSFLSGQLQEATRICNKILTGQPENSDALCLLGEIALRVGNPFKAAELIRDSIELRPGEANAYLSLGRALYQQGKLQEAVPAYRKAIKIQHNLTGARTLLESTRNEIKHLDETVKAFERSAQGPAIRFTHDEDEKRKPDLATLNRAAWLYRHFGYLIIEDLFSEQFIDGLYASFESEYSQYFSDTVFDDALKVGDKRVMVSVKLQGPFNNPEYYANPLVMPLLARLLGRDLILFSLGSVVSLPGAQLQRTHRDHRPLFEEKSVNAKLPSVAVTMGIPLIEMNNVNGTTRIYGKTHWNQDKLSDNDRKDGINPTIRKGSCMLFDYHLFHEGTPNNSGNVRPLMYNIYSRAWFRDCQNYTKQVPMAAISDDEFSKIPEECRHLFSWARCA